MRGPLSGLKRLAVAQESRPRPARGLTLARLLYLKVISVQREKLRAVVSACPRRRANLLRAMKAFNILPGRSPTSCSSRSNVWQTRSPSAVSPRSRSGRARLSFKATSTLGAGAVFKKRAIPSPKGKVSIDEKTGDFTYTPTGEDRDDFVVWIQARKGTRDQRQKVFITSRGGRATARIPSRSPVVPVRAATAAPSPLRSPSNSGRASSTSRASRARWPRT